MLFSTLAGLSLLLVQSDGVLAQGGRHTPQRMKHVARSPWGSDQPPQAGLPYDTCVSECTAEGGSWNEGGGGVYPAAEVSDSGYMMDHADEYAPSAVDAGGDAQQTSDPYAGAYPPSPPPADATANGAYGADYPVNAESSTWIESSWTSSATLVLGGSVAASSATPSPSLGNATGNATDAGLVAGPYQVIVAPKKGDLRMVPFNINVPIGQNVTFIWGAGPHTVTQSSPLTICNASQAVGAYKSGMQEKGFEFPLEITSSETQTYFCGVATHCAKGMFGLVNGLTVAVPEGSFGEAMPKMAANDSGLESLWNETKTKCKDSPSAWAWGDKLATSQLPEWAMPVAMENILYTRQFLVENPNGLAGASSSSSPSATDSNGNPASPSGTSTESSGSTRSTLVGINLALLVTFVVSLLVIF